MITCWKWDDAINNSLIDLFLKDVNAAQLEQGKIANSDNVNKVVRNSDVVLFQGIHYFAGILANYAMHANVLSNWNRQLTYGDTMQYAQYTEGQYYDWHTDCPPICNTPQHRKLTVVCLLNDPIEFEGGNLEIEINTTQATLQKGSVIVFPSVLRHRVTPVTKGIRKTATYWINGPATW